MDLKKNKIELISFFIASFLLLFMSLQFGGQTLPRESSLFKIGNDSFLFPAQFRVQQRSDVDDISFYINPITLQPQLPLENIKNLVEVKLLISSRHPGAFFRTENEVISKNKNLNCTIDSRTNIKLCEYIDNSLPKSPSRVTTYYTANNNPYLISRCTVSGVPSPLCTDWSYFSSYLKIAYIYPAAQNNRILEIDKAAKTMLKNFQQNMQEQ